MGIVPMLDIERTGEHQGRKSSSGQMSRAQFRNFRWPLLGLILFALLGTNILPYLDSRQESTNIPKHLAQARARCQQLKLNPGPPPEFRSRTVSDRFVPGTSATLIRNATIWTGRIDGLEIIHGDILLDKGLIKAVGRVDVKLLENVQRDLVTVDAYGAWVTSGIVDLHSHLGVNSVPQLSGANDGNSRKGITQPWLRSIDGLNTHDAAYRLSISGGVTTALVLPGSANDIGGQAFVIKLRETTARTPTSMVVEPPFTLNGTDNIDMTANPRWRHMKHACGENPRRVYGNSRMDNIWAFREIYDKAQQIKKKQDAFCEKVETGQWIGLGEFPEELQYEALVDVLRGRVKVNVHCYETVDLDDIVRLTNEFKFPIAALHHAHETYLVPDLLKQAYGQVPASATFATSARYKRESYRGSEYASKILDENDIPVVLKSDHPVLNSRYLLFEAQQAHYYGLRANRAMASVTSTPARAMGMDHRIGFISENFDADVVIWDSHPLVLGATPAQVFIDGVKQFENPHVIQKPKQFQRAPITPDFSREATEAVKYDGLPPIAPKAKKSGIVILANVTSIMVRADTSSAKVGQTIVSAFESSQDMNNELGIAVVTAGQLRCAGSRKSCASSIPSNLKDATIVDLKGGALAPALISYGSNLGLEEIQGEASTRDGVVYDALGGLGSPPSITGGDGALVRAADGLIFATRHAFLAYRSGVTSGISSPMHSGFVSGVGALFSLESEHRLSYGAVVKEGGVHVSIGHGSTSISTQVAALRRLLLGAAENEGSDEASTWFQNVVNGSTPLIVEAHSADVIATLLGLKAEVEKASGMQLTLTISGASEAHLLASELGAAGVGIVLNPIRQFPKLWEQRRILPGPPLTQDSTLNLLVANNVTVGLGVDEPWEARNARFDLAWAALEANGALSKSQALALASTNLEMLLGFEASNATGDLVITESGDIFGLESKVIGIISPRKGGVDLF